MRCKICNNRMSGDEVKYNKRYEEYDPCFTCKEASAPTPEQEQRDLEILEQMPINDINEALNNHED